MGWEEKNHDLFSAWNTSIGGRADSSADCLGRSLRSLSLYSGGASQAAWVCALGVPLRHLESVLWGCLSGILLLFTAAAEKTRGLTFLLTHKGLSQLEGGKSALNFFKVLTLGYNMLFILNFFCCHFILNELIVIVYIPGEQWHFDAYLYHKMVRLRCLVHVTPYLLLRFSVLQCWG